METINKNKIEIAKLFKQISHFKKLKRKAFLNLKDIKKEIDLLNELIKDNLEKINKFNDCWKDNLKEINNETVASLNKFRDANVDDYVKNDNDKNG